MSLRLSHILQLLLLCLVTIRSQAQDVSGRWQGTFDIPSPNGAIQHDTAFFILQQTGTHITGSAGRSEDMQSKITEGGIDGKSVHFSVEVRPGTTVRFDLELDGNRLHGTATGIPPGTGAKIVVDTTRAPAPTVDSILQHYMGTILVTRDGKVLLDKAYGSADLEWEVANTPATRFRIGSLTKQFTAASILILEERGRIHLNDPISMYIVDAPPAWKDVTLFHLLTHTSGIISLTDLPAEESALTRGGTPTEIVARFRDKPLLFAPGTQSRYSNSGYILLGLVIEKAAGESYGVFLQHNIFDPLGMRDTGIDGNDSVLARRASGYHIEAGVPHHADYIDMRIPFAAGDLYSTTADLQRWQQALFGGKVLHPQSLERMLTPNRDNFGLGVMVKQEDGQRLISHTGGIQGFVADLRYYPEKHLSVVVLSNTESEQTLELSRLLSQQALAGTLDTSASTNTLRDELLAADQKLFNAYNTCNISGFSDSLAADLEFFHDTTGLTDHDWNVRALRARCAEKTKYRRELEDQSVRIYPVPGYGALELGVHRFYEQPADGPEKLDGTPQFANVWRKTSEGWKLERVLSYGHL
jgi:CubicO group peptidase (beta-lactamase class C family)